MRVFYEDDHLAVVEKPAGIIVHRTPGKQERTFLDQLNDYFSTASMESDQPSSAKLVHRLDRGTSGLMIVARSTSAAQSLVSSFRERSIRKGYVALAFGSTPRLFAVKVPLAKISQRPARYGVDTIKGRKAETFFETAWSSDDFSLLKVKPITGRTNQIRIHSAWKGHPIVGDTWYRGTYTPITPWQKYLYRNASRLCLHAYHLDFDHPVWKARMRFWCPLPDSFLEIIRSVSSEAVNLDIP
jgi:23S rRNA pseudouridine1911/1915/1917 synthase